MHTIFFNLLRDVQHDAMVAWWYGQIDSTSFMSWQPVGQGFPRIAGC